VDAAHAAFEAWRLVPIAERARIVGRAGEIMAERTDRLAQLVTLEMGKLIGESRRDAARPHAADGPGLPAGPISEANSIAPSKGRKADVMLCPGQCWAPIPSRLSNEERAAYAALSRAFAPRS
jgi:hypothetical protein